MQHEAAVADVGDAVADMMVMMVMLMAMVNDVKCC